MDAHQLMWWRWKLGLGPRSGRSKAKSPVRTSSSSSPSFVELVMPVSSVSSSDTEAAAPIEVVVGQRRVLVRPGFDPESLRRVLAVLEGC